MEAGMKIKLVSGMVDDQDRALKFYTEVLGYVKKNRDSNGGIQVAHSRVTRWA